MLVSFSIFHKGGLMLYQHSPDIDPTEDDPENTSGSNTTTADSINTWLSEVYLNPTKSLTDRKAIIDGPSASASSQQTNNTSISNKQHWQNNRGSSNNSFRTL